MIGWFSNNAISRIVMQTLAESGIETKHLCRFKETAMQPSIFYGILRGSGAAMRILEYLGIDYWYIDNGYFDAEYINSENQKKMDGKFRFVKNGMHDVFSGRPNLLKKPIESVLLLPPSTYSANHHDTTPEDWMAAIKAAIPNNIMVETRGKGDASPLDSHILRHDAVVAFNSMSVIRASELGKSAYDTNGVFRNFHLFPQPIIYDINDLHMYYDGRQWTLDEIRTEGSIAWN